MRAPVGAAIAVVALLLTGCSFTVNQIEGVETGAGENSSFSPAGVQRIEEDGSAVIDLRGPLAADDLGADGGSLSDVIVHGDEPIEVTVLGTDGTLVVPANEIRVLVGADRDVQSIALFEAAEDADALTARLREVGTQVGADEDAMESFIRHLDDDSSDIWLNTAERLGFAVGLNPNHHPGGLSVIQYQLTPPD